METDAAFILSPRRICLWEDGQSDSLLHDGAVDMHGSDTESKSGPEPRHEISISHLNKQHNNSFYYGGPLL